MASNPALAVPEKGMDVIGATLVYSWKLRGFEKTIRYDLNKCIGCGLCKAVCPVNAIEMGPVVEVANGLLQETPMVMIDHEKCCYCFLCKAICPTSAIDIEVHPAGKIDLQEFPGVGLWYSIDKEKCEEGADPETCAACAEAVKQNSAKDFQPLIQKCPKNAIKFRSPFEGEVCLYRAQFFKCDPNGCKVCYTLCPTKAIYVPQKADDVIKLGKIAVDQDQCILCGACQACPEKLIEVRRTNVNIAVPESKYSWTASWVAIIRDLIEAKRQWHPPQQDPIHQPEGPKLVAAPITTAKPAPPSEEQMQQNLAIAAKAKVLLAKAKVRRWIEQGDVERVKAEIEKTME